MREKDAGFTSPFENVPSANARGAKAVLATGGVCN